MVNIKKIKTFINSKPFLLTFFSFLFASLLFYVTYKSYKYIENRQNIEAFVYLYDILERYQGALESNSILPLEELLGEIKKARKEVGYISSLRKVFSFLSYETETFVDTDRLILEKPNFINFKIHPFEFLFLLFSAIDNVMRRETSAKQEGLLWLKKLSEAQTPFRDVALFYYGYVLLKTTSLKQADEAWYPLLHDPMFNQSVYKELVFKARNLDF